MASIKTKAIVLGGIDVKEKDRLVDLFTLEQGRKLVSMRGVRGEKAKLKMAKEPFCFGEFVLEEGKGCVVTQVEIIDNFYDLTKDLDKYYEGCAILDLVKSVAAASEPKLFIELLQALKTLCYENVKKYYVFDKFLLDLTKFLGFSFFQNKCGGCGATLNIAYFDLGKGCFVCPNCKSESSIKLSNGAFKAVEILHNCGYEKLSTLQLSSGSEREVLKLLALNLEWRVGVKILKIK